MVALHGKSITDLADAINGGASSLAPLVDKEYICENNTWRAIVTTTPVNADGTLGTPVEAEVDTGRPCDEPVPNDTYDYEATEICNTTTGNKEIQFVQIERLEDGTLTTTNMGAPIDTGLPCEVNRDETRTKECFTRIAGIIHTLAEPELQGPVASTPVEIFTDEGDGLLTSIFVRLDNVGVTNVPYNITVSGFGFPTQVVPITPQFLGTPGFNQGEATPGVYIYELQLATPIQTNGDITLTGDNVAGVEWTASANNANGQITPFANGNAARVILATGGLDKYCRKTTFGGDVVITGPNGAEIAALPSGTSEAPCDASGATEVTGEVTVDTTTPLRVEIVDETIKTLCYEEALPATSQLFSGTDYANDNTATIPSGDSSTVALSGPLTLSAAVAGDGGTLPAGDSIKVTTTTTGVDGTIIFTFDSPQDVTLGVERLNGNEIVNFVTPIDSMVLGDAFNGGTGPQSYSGNGNQRNEFTFLGVTEIELTHRGPNTGFVLYDVNVADSPEPNSYKVTVKEDGTQTACDELGNDVDITAGIPATWTQVACANTDATEVTGELSITQECKQDLAEKIANEIAQTQGTQACFVTPSQTGDALSENAVLSNLDGQNEADVTYPGAISNEQVLNFGQMASDIGYPYPTFDDADIQVNSLKVIVENPSGNTGFVGWNIAGNVSDQTFPVTANMPPTEVTFTFSGGVQSPSNTVNPSSTYGLGSNPTFPNNADGTGGTNNGMRGNLNFASRPDTDQINIGIGATGMLVEIDFDYAPPVKATITTFPDGTKSGISNGATLTEAEITNFETNGVSVECEVDEPAEITGTVDVNCNPECNQDQADKINVIIGLNKSHTRITDGTTTTVPANYRSVSVTAYSADVTIDGAAIEQGQTVSIDSNRYEQYVQDTIVAGQDYLITIVTNA
jgi:hypothetical protein